MTLKPKDWKKLIGTEIGLIPRENAIKKGVSIADQISSGILTKVGTSNLTVEGHKVFNMYGELDCSNYAFLPFPTKKLAEEHLEAVRLSSKLKNSPWTHLSLAEVKQIEQILNN